jgi:hypothetical protein
MYAYTYVSAQIKFYRIQIAVPLIRTVTVRSGLHKHTYIAERRVSYRNKEMSFVVQP